MATAPVLFFPPANDTRAICKLLTNVSKSVGNCPQIANSSAVLPVFLRGLPEHFCNLLPWSVKKESDNLRNNCKRVLYGLN